MGIVRRKILICLCAMTLILSLVGCVQDRELLNNRQSTEEDIREEDIKEEDIQEEDTGAWESITVYYNGYRIDIEGPKVGSPNDSLWSTYYEDENEKDVNVDFYGIDGSLKERIKELTAEGKEVSKGWLWGNECQFYIDKATICMIPLGKDAYLQVEFTHEEDSLAELTRVSDGFTLTIEK